MDRNTIELILAGIGAIAAGLWLRHQLRPIPTIRRPTRTERMLYDMTHEPSGEPSNIDTTRSNSPREASEPISAGDEPQS